MWFLEMMLLSMTEQHPPPQEEHSEDTFSTGHDVAGAALLEAATAREILFAREVGDPFAAVREYTGFAWARRTPEDAA